MHLNHLACFVACTALFAGRCLGDIVYNDGQSHTLSTVENQLIVLQNTNGPYPPFTSLEVLPGGNPAGGVKGIYGSLLLHGGSISGSVSGYLNFEMTSGTFGTVGKPSDPSDTSIFSASISGGTGGSLTVGGNALSRGGLNMTGGSITSLQLSGGGSISGGSIGTLSLAATGVTSQATISGTANVDYVSFRRYSTIAVTGGTVGTLTGYLSDATISGGHVTGPLQGFATWYELDGTSFNIPFGAYVEPGPLHITGILADGSPIDVDFNARGDGVMYDAGLILKQVPEPAILSGALATIATVFCRRRKR